jgi:hypothetical protein
LKKIIIVCLILAVVSSFLYGCKEIGKEEFEYIDSSGIYFIDIECKGVGLWFHQWYMDIDEVGNTYGKNSVFTIDGKSYQHGVGMDGLTIEGKDLREFSFIKYKILQGQYSEVRCIFGFDDRTKVKSDTKLTAYADDKKIFESPVINSKVNSINIKFQLPMNIKTISFRIDTHVVNGTTPKIILADLKAKKR